MSEGLSLPWFLPPVVPRCRRSEGRECSSYHWSFLLLGLSLRLLSGGNRAVFPKNGFLGVYVLKVQEVGDFGVLAPAFARL